jgi:hypothetical protein
LAAMAKRSNAQGRWEEITVGPPPPVALLDEYWTLRLPLSQCGKASRWKLESDGHQRVPFAGCRLEPPELG